MLSTSRCSKPLFLRHAWPSPLDNYRYCLSCVSSLLYVESPERQPMSRSPSRHDNIVRYYGSGVKGKQLNIFLEYMPGGSIRKILEGFGPFEENITRLYAAQLMRGLEFLHSKGVAHRDIKVGARRCVCANQCPSPSFV